MKINTTFCSKLLRLLHSSALYSQPLHTVLVLLNIVPYTIVANIPYFISEIQNFAFFFVTRNLAFQLNEFCRNLTPICMFQYFRITKYENVGSFVSFNVTKLQFLIQISWKVLPGIIFRAGNSLHVSQCKIPPESTKPLLVEQSRGNGFTFRTPVHTFLLTQSRCLETVTRRNRVKTLPLRLLCLKWGFVYNAVQVSKWNYNFRIFRITSRLISHMNLVNSSYYSLQIHWRPPALVSLLILTNSIQKSSSSDVRSCTFIQNLLPFLKSSNILLPFYKDLSLFPDLERINSAYVTSHNYCNIVFTINAPIHTYIFQVFSLF